MFETFWKSKYKKFGIVLKSGYEIKFEATDLEWTFDKRTGAITGYTIVGFNPNHPQIRQLDVGEIVAIIRYP